MLEHSQWLLSYLRNAMSEEIPVYLNEKLKPDRMCFLQQKCIPIIWKIERIVKFYSKSIMVTKE